jgi:lysozyme
MIPEAAIELCKKWEGFRPEPYLCPAGVPTIGYGTVIDSLDHPPVTEAEATELLIRSGRFSLGEATLAALRFCPVLIYEPEHRLAAVASFTYNLGATNLQTSTLRKKINAQDWTGAANEFHRWVWAGSRKLPGLIARRADEAAVFMGHGAPNEKVS